MAVRDINNRDLRQSNTLTNSSILTRTVRPELIQARLEKASTDLLEIEYYLNKYPNLRGKNYSLEYLKQYDKSRPNETLVSKDTKTKAEHVTAQRAAKQELGKSRQLKEALQATEIINHPYNPIGWIPGVRTMANVGADLTYSRNTGQAWTPYTLGAATSAGADALTLGFGIGPWKNYAGAYAGNVAGGLVGELFGHSGLGLFTGGLVGGISPALYNTLKTSLFKPKRISFTNRTIPSLRRAEYLKKIKKALIYLPIVGGLIFGNQALYKQGGKLKLVQKKN